MNYPPYDPRASQYSPPPGRPFPANGPSSPSPIPQPAGLEKKFHDLPAWARFGLIGLCACIFIGSAVVLFIMVGSLMGSSSEPQATDPTPTALPTATPSLTALPTATPSPTPTVTPVHYPPTTVADLHALATLGNASTIHEFHSGSVGLAGACPQPKRGVTVDPSVTGQQLAEDLLAYFYSQGLDSPCGSVVLAFHNQGEAKGAYTAGRIVFEVTNSSGADNVDPNASNLKHTLTIDVGPFGSNQEFVVTY